MAKKSRKKANEKKDFQKVKFKVGKKKPQGLNVTDTAFKSKGVTILAQFQSSRETVTSGRGIGIKEICSLLSHRTPSQRTFAFNELGDLLTQSPAEILDNLAEILNAILPRLLDEDSKLRQRCCQSLEAVFHILGGNVKTILEPFASLIINYIICGLSHANTLVAKRSLDAVDLLPKFLDLKSSSQETTKLLKALVSMISSSAEKKKTTVINLLSVGDFAEKLSRIQVMAKILAIIEVICHVDAEETIREEIVMWDITEPTSFALRSSFMVDLEPRPIVWTTIKQKTSTNKTASGSSAMKNDSPMGSLMVILMNIGQLICVYWPTVFDDSGESDITYFDLAGRRCCQDVLKCIIGYVRHLFLDEERIDINSLSQILLDAIKTVTGQNPLPRHPISRITVKGLGQTMKKLSKSISTLGELVLPSSFQPSPFLGIDQLNRNALSLLEVYRQFVTDTGGSQELHHKLNHEITKLQKHLSTLDTTETKRRKRKESDSSENIPLFDFTKNSTSACADAVMLDHSYNQTVPEPLTNEPDVVICY